MTEPELLPFFVISDLDYWHDLVLICLKRGFDEMKRKANK